MIRRCRLAAGLILAFLLAVPARAASNPFFGRDDRDLFSSFAAGLYLSACGDWSGALARFQRAYQIRPGSTEVLLKLSESFLATEQVAEARLYATRALAVDSGLADAFLILADAALAEQKWIEADSWLQARIDAMPDDAESRLRLGFLREERRDLEGAIRAFSNYPSQRPGATVAAFHRAVALASLKRYAEARDAFRDVTRLAPDNAESWQNIALLSVALDDESGAIDAWGEVLRLDPSNQAARWQRLKLFTLSERFIEAQAELQDLIVLAPDREIILKPLLAQLALKNDSYLLAAQTMLDFARTTGSETAFLDAALIAGRVSGETGLVIEGLGSAFRLGGKPAVGILLAQTYALNTQETDALAITDSLLAANPFDTGALWLKGLIFDRLKDRQKAVNTLLQLIAIDPQNAAALNYVGYTWAEKGVNLAKAESFILRALKIEPDNPQYLDSLGWVYYQRGRFKRAAEELEKAHVQIPNEPTVMEHLGDAYRKLGRKADALALYQRALATGEAERPEALRKKIEKLSSVR